MRHGSGAELSIPGCGHAMAADLVNRQAAVILAGASQRSHRIRWAESKFERLARINDRLRSGAGWVC